MSGSIFDILPGGDIDPQISDLLEKYLGDILGGGGLPDITDILTGGGSGGLLDMILGAGAATGPVGMAMSLFSMISGFGKKKNVRMSGVDPIFDSGIRNVGGGLDGLMSSDIFARASFSGRNVDGGMLRKFASARTAPEVTVKIQPSKEFDAISEDRWVKTSKLNEMAGIPRRTNFNHG